MDTAVVDRDETLVPYRDAVMALFSLLKGVFEEGGTLFVCGNGGSFADSIHIVGELVKSFERPRPPAEEDRRRLASLYGGDVLASRLEQGLPAVALGTNPALVTALINDVEEKEILFAQELFVLGCEGDALLGISTSGNARDVLLAMSVARALGMKTAALTGKDGGRMKDYADAAVVVRRDTTREVQQVHQAVYHALCLMLEECFFG